MVRPPELPHAPPEVEAALKLAFPNAVPGGEFADALLRHLDLNYQINPKQILFGISTCVDDVIYTKDFHHHPEIKGPFHLGGLAGLPFTGLSGLEAFAHHIPEGGTMMIVVEPHIGYSATKGWGYILRHQQSESSACCGALMGTLGKLQAGKLSGSIREADYQGDKIAELALRHKNEIVSAASPILALTRRTSLQAAAQIREQLLELELKHIKYVVLVTGTLINTDFSYSDYQAVDGVVIYDAQNKQLVEEVSLPFPSREVRRKA
jgi:hypothetical protein